MDNTHDTGRCRLGFGLLLLLVAAAGCDPRSADSNKGGGGGSSKGGGDILCPSCRATAGGETGDFSPARATCAFAYAKREVDASEADALGFAGTAAVRAIEKPIDAAMTWAVVDTEGGGPAHGYEPETQVRLELAVDTLTFNELDLDKCDNQGCVDDGEAGVCLERFIMVSASGELHTSDGAVSADLPAQDVRILMPEDDDISVAAHADLREVRGSLQLDPAIPEPRVGVLDLSLQFTPKGALEYGVIDISIYPDWSKLRDEDGVPIDSGLDLPAQSSYRPLEGRWGSAPPVTPLVGGQAQP